MKSAPLRSSAAKPTLLSQIIGAGVMLGAMAFGANQPPLTSPSPEAGKTTAPIETDGTLDLSFNAGQFTNGQVQSSALQADGKVLIGGVFSKVHGITRLGLARLNSDGTLDSSFVPPAGTVFNAQNILLQPDGRIIIITKQSPTLQFVRLNIDGSLDNAFNASPTISRDGVDDGAGNATNRGLVNSAVIQPDGKIVIVGHFFYIITGPGNSVARSGVARLNSDGTLDASFDPKGGLFRRADSLSTTGDFVVRQKVGSNNGKIIIEGNFDAFDFQGASERVNLPGLVRLNTDGSYDATFDAGFGSESGSPYVRGLFVQADDKLIIFGNQYSHFGVISRLNTAGQADPGFTAPTFGNYDNFPHVLAVAQQSDGKLVVGGIFHSLIGTTANNVARLQTNGARDNSFDSVAAGPLASNVSTLLFRAADQKVLVGGYFSTYGTATRNNLAWANSNGSVDTTMTDFSGATDANPEIYAIATQPDGKIVVGGLFSSFKGMSRYNIVRLNRDSSVDFSFDPALGTAGSIRALLVQDDGKIVIAGNFLAVNGVGCGRIARLNGDGTLDSSFNAGTGADNVVHALGKDSAGNLYVGGAFSMFNGAFASGIVKLTATGAVDPTFNPSGGGTNSTVFSIVPPDASGRLMIAGQFSRYNGLTKRAIARVNAATGALDTSFNTPNTYFGLVKALVATPDGKYYSAGSDLVRWNSNGTRDTTFSGPALGGYSREALLLQNGKLIVAGINAPSAPGLIRLTDTGAVDSSFAPGSGVEVSPVTAYRGGEFAVVRALAIQDDGKLLLGGFFNRYNGTTRFGLARLTGPGAAEPPPGLVVNVATRLPVGTGDNALIQGFIVQGPAGSTKKIMVRALGPFLTQFGITDALPDPTLEIRDGNNVVVATNNDWKTTQTGGIITGDQSGEISSSGLAPSNDLESAVIADLLPGNYTAVVRGVGNTTGTGIVDAYDMSAGSPARVANIATRGFIQPGDKLMIAGFIIQNGSVRAAIRAIGPSLTQFGISNALPDTTLELRDQNGGLMLDNDDWKSNPVQKQELESNNLQPGHDLEAALITTIPPGQYTAQVRGKGEASGIGVVEVYFLQ